LMSTPTLPAAPPWEAADLNPVTLKAAPKHAAVALVKGGAPLASIVTLDRPAGAAALQHFIEAATGAKLPVVKQIPDGPAVVLGDCEQAAALGLSSGKLPPEGFAIKTAANRVHIVGRNSGRSRRASGRYSITSYRRTTPNALSPNCASCMTGS